MSKKQLLLDWLIKKNDWVYLKEVPFHKFFMSRADCSSSLIDLCLRKKAEFRVVGLKQYKAIQPKGKK